MKPKVITKLIIDVAMTVIFLVLMAYRVIGNNTVHELLGVSLFVLFILHHILNLKSYKTMFREKGSLTHASNIAVNLLLFILMIGIMISSVMVSRTVFRFLDIGGDLFARKLHVFTTNWSFILIAIHLGFHWNMVIGMMRKLATKRNNLSRSVILRRCVVLIDIYGIYASFKYDIGAKLLMRYGYSFWNSSDNPFLFFLDYLSIMGFYISIAYYTSKLFLKRRKTEGLHELS